MLDAPAEVGVEEALDVAVQDLVETSHRIAGASILDTLIGMQEVVADLRAEPDPRFALVLAGFLGLALFLFESRELGAEMKRRCRKT